MRAAIVIVLTFIIFPMPVSSQGEPGDDRFSAADTIASANVDRCGRNPLVAEFIGWYYDGGTVGASITDSSGCLVEFFIDHGLESATPGALYVGARVPSSPNASKANVAEEKHILQLVVQVLKSTCGKDYPSELSQLIEGYARDLEGAKLIQRLLDLLKGC